MYFNSPRYSTSWQIVGKERYRWLDRNRLEILDRDNTKLTILAYFDTLAFAIEASRRLNTSGRGICGSSNGEWERDILESDNMTSSNKTAIFLPLDNLTQASHDQYINKLTRVSNTTMITEYAVAYRTGGGYMLSLGMHYLSLIVDFTYPVLSEISIELWIKLSVFEAKTTVGAVLMGKRVLYRIMQNENSLTVWYDSEIVIEWGSHTINTGLMVKESLWTHLSLTWRNTDGRLVIMLVDNNGPAEKSIHYAIMINHFFYVDKGFYFGNDGKEKLSSVKLVIELDELRIWQFARKEEDIMKEMTEKVHDYIAGLIIFFGFDEGYGKTTNGTLFELSDNATTAGYYHRGDKTLDREIVYEMKPQSVNPPWKPSGAPYSNVGDYEINFDSGKLKSEAENRCHTLFYTGDLFKYCSSKLITQTLFYYEACLMDVAHSGNIEHTKLSVSTFAFYCQKVLVVPSCRLHGFYDGFPACEEETGLEVFRIVLISVSGVVLLLLILLSIILLCKRRRRKEVEYEVNQRRETADGVEMYGNMWDDDSDFNETDGRESIQGETSH